MAKGLGHHGSASYSPSPRAPTAVLTTGHTLPHRTPTRGDLLWRVSWWMDYLLDLCAQFS